MTCFPRLPRPYPTTSNHEAEDKHAPSPPTAESLASTVEEPKPMQLKQVRDNCFAVLSEKNHLCDANSGLINRAGGMVIDTPKVIVPGHQF